MRPALWCLIAASLPVLTACGGDAGVPPTPVPSALTIEGPPDPLFLGQRYRFTMAARLSNGTMRSSGGTWGSDAPGVATVDAEGAVAVVGVGEATIFVDYQGQRATRRLTTTVQYQGALDTTARTIGCTHTGYWRAVDYCSVYPDGTEVLVSGVFTQEGRMVSAAMQERRDGTWGLVIQLFPAVMTSVSETGDLRIESMRESRSEPAPGDEPGWVRMQGRWTLRPVGLTQIGGTFVFRQTASDYSGYYEVEARIAPASLTDPAEIRGGSPADRAFALLFRAGRGWPRSRDAV